MRTILILLPAILMAGPALAQTEGTFPGTLFCDGATGIAGSRDPVRLTLAGSQATYTVSPEPGSGRPAAAEKGSGALAPGGQIVLAGSAKGAGISYQARYSGELGGRGGLLGGTQTGTAGGKSFTRRCQMSLGNGRG